MKILKLIGINLLILTILVVIVELCFGGWIIQKNILQNYNILYSSTYYFDVSHLYPEGKEVTYSRDENGLRISGDNNLKNINIMTIGGSTTDQRYISDGKTWQDAMYRKLKQDGIKANIANVGIDGQSTFGHLKNFEIWFPLVPELQPKYILFYIGINDFYADADKYAYITDPQQPNLKTRIKNCSATYNLFRKLQGAFKSRVVKVSHSKIDFSKLNYVDQPLLDSAKYETLLADKLPGYRERISKLAELSKKMGATPVFISQPCRKFILKPDGSVLGVSETENYGDVILNGVDYYHMLTMMNKMIEDICREQHYDYFDLTQSAIWEATDFYDFAHNTPAGCEKLGNEIAGRMAPILKKN
jgi:lysophospholipase L1-like esterase